MMVRKEGRKERRKESRRVEKEHEVGTHTAEGGETSTTMRRIHKARKEIKTKTLSENLSFARRNITFYFQLVFERLSTCIAAYVYIYIYVKYILLRCFPNIFRYAEKYFGVFFSKNKRIFTLFFFYYWNSHKSILLNFSI